jgi:hypothetical protein
MKKSRINKVISLLMALCITIVSPTFAMASSTESTSDNVLQVREVTHTKEFVVDELHKIGFTDEEIESLFERFPYDENESLLEFVPNGSMPKGDSLSQMSFSTALESATDVDDKDETYYISTSYVKGLGHTVSITSAGLGLSKSTWAKIIVKKVGWKITLLAGVIAAAVADMFMGPNGVRIDVTYRWTYGDQSMEWFWAPIDYSISKY